MKRILLAVPLALSLYACGDEIVKESEEKVISPPEATETGSTEQKVSVAEQSEWEIDERLQEPTEATTCYMCNMKVYTREHEQGLFSAQAILESGEVVFYDDIGCLLSDEYVNKVVNEKFVRDYHTLNWFKVEDAYAVKTDMKSPMNWGYIFFKFEKDAKAYIEEHGDAAITSIDEIRDQAIERHKKKNMNSGEGHNHNHNHSTTEEDSSSEEHNKNMSSDE